MSAIKLKKIGNSVGFTLPSRAIAPKGLKVGDDFELIVHEHGFSLIKKRPPVSQWKFPKGKAKANAEDRAWLKAKLDEVDE